MPRPRHRQRIVIVGAGFAGFRAARRLARRIGDAAEIALGNPTDYFLYLALPPEVAGGVLDLRRIAVPLQSALPGVRVLLGTVDQVDLHTGPAHPMTAQHAVRQGRRAARNLAASLGHGRRRAYRHHDLGFVVDLAGAKAAANPLGVPLSGLPAKAVTRGYRLRAIPANRVRIACEWLLDAVLSRQAVQLGLVRAAAVPLAVDRWSSRSGPDPVVDAARSSQTTAPQDHLGPMAPATGQRSRQARARPHGSRWD
jgi:NADH dehydrogenase FAD-containing subunit